MDSTHDGDPFLAALLDEVLAVHQDLGADVLAEMRAVLELVATTHPTGAAIVDRARPRAPVQRSGDQATPAAARAPHEEVDDADKAGRGGG
jgi:hypothetical protein